MALNLNIVSKFNDKGIKEAQASFGGIGSSLAKLGGIIAAAFSVRAITNFAKESIAAAEGVQVANQRLDQIAKSMGIFGQQTQAVSDRLKAYAESNELLLATDAEVIKATQAKLLTFKELAQTADETGGAFDRATAAAVDLAAAGFGTAEGNAVQLGKALNNPIKGITALTRSGITFTDAEKAKIKTLTQSGQILEAQNLILSAIETQVGGTAAATATASEKMKLSFDNIREAFGAGLMPAFQGFADAMFPVFQKMGPIIEKLGGTISAILVPAFEKFGAFMEASFIPFFDSATNAFSNFVTGIQDGSINLTTSITGIFERIAEMRMAFFSAITNALPGIIEAFANFLPELIDFLLNELAPALIAELANIVVALANVLVENLPKLVNALIQAIPTLLQGAITLFNSLVQAFVFIVPQLVQAVVDLLPKLVESLIQMLPALLDGAIQLFTALVDAIPIILPILIDAIFDLLPAIIDALIQMLPKLVDGAFMLFMGIMEAMLKAWPLIIAEFIKLIPQITKLLIDNLPKLIDAGFQLISGLVKGIIENAPRLIGQAVQSVGSLLVNGMKSFLGIQSPSKVFYGIGENVGEGLVNGLIASEASVAQATERLIKEATKRANAALAKGLPYASYGKADMVTLPSGKQMNLGAFTDLTNDITNSFGGVKTGLNRTADLLGGTTQQLLDVLFEQQTFIKDGMQVVASISNAAERDRLVNQGFKAVERISKSVEEVSNQVQSVARDFYGGNRDGAGAGSLDLYAMARGGFVRKPTPALVGEAGPEVVMPLDQFLPTVLGRKTGESVNINITVNAGMGADGVSIGREIVNAIKRYERTNGQVFASA